MILEFANDWGIEDWGYLILWIEYGQKKIAIHSGRDVEKFLEYLSIHWDGLNTSILGKDGIDFFQTKGFPVVLYDKQSIEF